MQHMCMAVHWILEGVTVCGWQWCVSRALWLLAGLVFDMLLHDLWQTAITVTKQRQ